MADLTFLERLIAIARAAELAERDVNHASTCALEDAVAIAVDEKHSITPRAVSLIFRGRTQVPRDETIQAFKDALKAPVVKKRFKGILKGKDVPPDWDSLPRADLLAALQLPADTALVLQRPKPKLRPFHQTLRDAYRAQPYRDRITAKYGGVYSIYRRHARKKRESVVEDVMWFGFISDADLPQALLLSSDGVMVGEVAPSQAAWSFQFVSLNGGDKDLRIDNDSLRMERRGGRAYMGVRARRSQNGANVGYRVVLVRHKNTEMSGTDPDLDQFISNYSSFISEHAPGSQVHDLMFKLLEDDDANAIDADRGVLHSRGSDLDDLETFDPTDRPASNGNGDV